MKKTILFIVIALISLSIFAAEQDSYWSVDLDCGTYITPIGSKPYFNVEAMYQSGVFLVGGESEVKIKDWGIDEAGIFGKMAIAFKLANIYTELGVGVGFVTNKETVELKYKPEFSVLIDMGDYVLESRVGILIKDKFDKDNAYISIGVQKRFFKELE